MMEELDILNAFVGKVISDCIDISINAIKKANRNRVFHNQNMETRIYQVTIDALNEFTYKKYKRRHKLYDAAEIMLKGFKSYRDNIDAIKQGLKMLISDVNDNTCKDFMQTLCCEICKEQNGDLYKEINLIWRICENKNNQKEFRKSHQSDERILGELEHIKGGIYCIKENMNTQEKDKLKYYEIHKKNRAQNYADKWFGNVFLNDFDKRDENTGVNVKLKDIYLEEHLPNYIWATNTKPRNDLKKLLREYTVDNNDKKMLLILGQPGIGKSTLITWIMVNFMEKRDKFLVYQFASDLKGVNWKSENILNNIFENINLKSEELENRALILDGFDEIYISGDRERILNQLYYEINEMSCLKRFSLIITCRENYVYKLYLTRCDFITLQVWNDKQIQSFCNVYGDVSKSRIAEDTINMILENKEVFGIPLILYMVLALNICIDKKGSIGNIFDRIFALDGGGIYDRCIRNMSYASPHRICTVKQQIHEASQKIAFWMFENNPEGIFISQKDYKEICDSVVSKVQEKSEDIQSDVLIGSYFKLIKHCEGIGTDQLQFVHRFIYEYFVAVYFYESMRDLASKEVAAGKLGLILKDGYLSKQMLQIIKYKFDNLVQCNLPDTIKEIFQIMLRDGMTYYVGKPLLDIIDREMNVFCNMLEIVCLWDSSFDEFDDHLITYLHYNKQRALKLKGMQLDNASLSKVYLSGANLEGTCLEEADLSGANLEGANLEGANLEGANLEGANLKGVNLKGANLKGTNLKGAHLDEANLEGAHLRGTDLYGDVKEAHLEGISLRGAIFDEEQVNWLSNKYDLYNSQLRLSKTGKIVSYSLYQNMMRKK